MHLDGLTRPPPHFPSRRPSHAAAQMAASAVVHLVAVFTLLALTTRATRPPAAPHEPALSHGGPNVTHIVFIARDLSPSGGGGGGGGNRQPAPIRRAEAMGHDPITLRIATVPSSSAHHGEPSEFEPIPAILLDARPLASGMRHLLGLPEGGVPFGNSLGPGSGAGVGTGSGAGIGSGAGDGLGAGSGGGTGGGIYRPGGNVKPPKVVTQVKPKYTEDALVRKTQGTVTLEMIVRTDGTPHAIRVIGSLDPDGLDAAAIEAARQWRFEPGRRGDTPVDVLVTLMLDFRIQ